MTYGRASPLASLTHTLVRGYLVGHAMPAKCGGGLATSPQGQIDRPPHIL